MSTITRKTGRPGTKGTYGAKQSAFLKKEATSSSVPHAPIKEDSVVEEDKAPSYDFVDKQKGYVDAQAENEGKEDEAIRESRGKNKDDEEQTIVKFKPAKNAVKGNQREDQPHTEGKAAPSSDFAKYWALETDYQLEDEVHSDKNTWTPNALGLFEILNATGSFVYDNRVIAKHHPDYLDYAVACYYSILFYIQILRAKDAAGTLVGEDASFYRRFFRKVKAEELPISGPLVPYFSTIVSTLLPDSKYNWITPDYNHGIFNAQLDQWTPGNGACFIQPMVPYMLGILRYSIQLTTETHLADEDANHNPIHFDDQQRFVVHRLERANPHEVFHMPWQQHLANQTAQSNSFLTSCGLSYPFFADHDTLRNAAPKWRKSSFRNFPVTAVPSNHNADRIRLPNGNLGHADDRAKTLLKLEDFLCMEKNSDLEWFLELVRQAGIHARFFNSVSTLSDIPVTSGLETLIPCKFLKIVNGVSEVHADVTLGLDTQNGSDHLDWYPETFSNFVGQFSTTREGTTRQEALQAFTFGTNGVLNVTHNGHLVGAEVDVFRCGSYWNNNELAATKFHDAGTLGKPHPEQGQTGSVRGRPARALG